MFDFLIDGFGVALTPLNLGLALLGALLGTLFGALPGIGPINGIAILMPLAYMAAACRVFCSMSRVTLGRS